ncbi:MAG: glycine cleavage system protein GcvH [Alphaproteobacteria bacterium]
MSNTKYTEDHEWIRVDGTTGTVGITEYAAGQLGDVVYVELPEIGKAVKKAQETATVESVKAASEIYAPVTGEVTEVNAALQDQPELINTDPTGEGWFFKVSVSDQGETEGLMDETAYQDYVKGLE